MIKSLIVLALTSLIYSRSIAQEFSDPSRTEYKNDAGQQGSKSGFFQTVSPVNYPAGASIWWHLLDVRHSNPNNNYAMQFAGSFFDQNLYFRKTNNNPSQGWSKILMADSYGNIADNISFSNTAPLQFTSIGTGVYNRSVVYNNNSALIIERARQTDDPNATVINFEINRRGGGTPAFLITGNDNIGIGTNDPGPYKLAVEGILGARRIKVTQVSPWADYVFDSSYRLQSLSQVEAFIKQNKHLPDIPSAKEVEDKGLDIGDNQSLLLRKIEELTLYVIEQNKQLIDLKKEIARIKLIQEKEKNQK
jgi:hypothetical protein